jgi:parallel beta-helix repeat protein
MRKLNSKLAMFIFGGLSWINPVEAAVIYVDKDSSCPGSGSSSFPYCSIQRALDVVRPGDVVRIRDSANPYDERAVAIRSGTSSAPITIEPDVGHNPRLRYSGRNAQTGVIEIRDADYWYIRGLTFDGSGIQTSRYAVLLYAHSRDITGHKIAKNAFFHWGGTGENTASAAAVILRPSYSGGFNNFRVRNSVISENTFAYNSHESIRLTRSANVVIERNTIQYSQCGRGADGTAGATAIKDSQGSVGTIIRNNTIRDHQMSEDCPLPNQGHATYTGIYCDTGPTSGEIVGNVIYNIDKGRAFNSNPRATGVNSMGIFIESRCSDWKVHHNVVYYIGSYGLRNGSSRTADPDRTAWTNNTVFSISRNALWIARGKNLTVKNNILLHNQANASIELTGPAVYQGPHNIDHNLYWDMKDGTKIGRWGDFWTRNLTNWRQACKCDSEALSTNPLFMSVVHGSENLRLSSFSPARRAGEGGVDLGAYQSESPPPTTNPPAAPTWISIQ